MQRRLRDIFNNRLLQCLLFGAFITFVVSIVWDVPVERFVLKSTGDVNNITADDYLWFIDDFDNDGNTEKLRCFNSSFGGRLSIVSYNHQNQIVSAHHFENDSWTSMLTPALADIDKDGTKDFLFFSLINDSIFFTAVAVVDDKILIDHLFFMRVERYSEKMGVQSEFYPESLTMNEFDNELLFHFDAGYGLYPRGIFKMNLNSGKFIIPDKTYSPYRLAQFKDLDNDGIQEIIVDTYAPSNISFETEFSDSRSYIAAFTSSLDYFIRPIPVKHEYSKVKCIADVSDTLFYALIFSGVERKISVVSSAGNILNSQDLPQLDYELNGTLVKTINNSPHLIISNYGYFPLTPDLKFIPGRELDSQNNLHYLIDIEDIDSDGFDEIISQIPGRSMWIYSTRYNHFTSAELPVTLKYPYTIVSNIKEGEFQNYLFVAGSAYFAFNYWKNQWYFIIYLIYFSLFVFFSGIIYLLLFLQQKRLEKKWDIDKQLSELQFNSVKSQLHPHFMFNVLNSVAYMINTGRKEEAYDFLTVNSRMIQQVMDDAREVKRSLDTEIKFTQDYLKIQQHRFKERFRTEFTIHPEVDLNVKVPKMCIHTYVENAVKHGFRNTKNGGLLQINVSPAESGVFITVTDNGMGRREASTYHDSTGHGLAVMNEFYRLFEKYHGYQIDAKIIDLNREEHDQTGTQIKLKIQQKELSNKNRIR